MNTAKPYHVRLKDFPDLLDINQLSELLGVSTKTGYKMLKNGKIHALKVGRAYRIPKANVLSFFKQQNNLSKNESTALR